RRPPGRPGGEGPLPVAGRGRRWRSAGPSGRVLRGLRVARWGGCDLVSAAERSPALSGSAAGVGAEIPVAPPTGRSGAVKQRAYGTLRRTAGRTALPPPPALKGAARDGAAQRRPLRLRHPAGPGPGRRPADRRADA